MKQSIFSNILESLETTAFNLYWNKFSKMNFDEASNLGSKLGRKLGPLSSSDKTARRNIRLAFPNISTIEENELIDGMWDNLGRLAGEMPHIGEFGYYTPNARVKVVNAEQLFEYKNREKSAVFISGHFADWEVMAAVIINAGVDCQVTYRELNNKTIDKIIRDAREKYGIKLFAAKGKAGGMQLMRILAKKGSIAIMNDQKYNTGVKSKLFGHDCMTNDASVRLAHRFKIPIQPLSLKRLGGVNFEANAAKPIILDYDKPVEEIMQQEIDNINKFVETKVLEAPEQWFWVHKRWPKEAWKNAGVL